MTVEHCSICAVDYGSGAIITMHEGVNTNTDFFCKHHGREFVKEAFMGDEGFNGKTKIEVKLIILNSKQKRC